MMNVSTSGKSRLQDKLDKWFWWIIALLPLIFWLFVNIGCAYSATSRSYVYLNTVLQNHFALDFTLESNGNLIYRVLFDIFGKNGGIFPLFEYGSSYLQYFVYFVTVQILHVLIDVLVFIPRFAHKILSKAINFGE